MKRVGLIALVAVLCSCGEGGDENGSVTIGALMPLEGRFAFLAQSITGAMDVARNEINEGGGILGQTLRIELRSDTSGEDAARVAAEVEELETLGVQASLVASSAGALFALPEAADRNMLLMSGSAASPALSAEEDDLFFRTIQTVLAIGTASAHFIADEGVESIAMISVSNDALYDFIGPQQAAELESLGVTVELNERYDFDADTPGSFDPSAVLEMVYTSGADALWIGAYGEDGAVVMQALDRTRFTGRIYGGTGFNQPQLIEIVGASKLEGMSVITSIQPEGDAFERFRAAYMDTNQSDVDFYAILQVCTYDAMAVLALAMTAAGSNDAIAIRDQLRNVAGPPGVVVEAGQIAQGMRMVEMGMDVNYEGMGSPVDFDAQGDIGTAYGAWRFTGGELQYLQPLVAGVDY